MNENILKTTVAVMNPDEILKKLEEETGITYTYVESILNTLPISFYLGRDVAVTLSKTSDTSYYDLLKDNITVSYPSMVPMMKNILSEVDKESIVRGILYHELSHAMWSPSNLIMGLDNFYKDVMNVFCDERIETYNADLFMNTDFKRNIILLNDWHGEEPEDAFGAFYHAVRFRQNTEHINDRINTILEQYVDIMNEGTKECRRYFDSYGSTERIRNYQREVKNLFMEIAKDWLEKNKKEELEKAATEMGMTSGKGGATGKAKSYDDLSKSEKEKVVEKVAHDEGTEGGGYAGVGFGIPGTEGEGEGKDKRKMLGGCWHIPTDEDEEAGRKDVERMSNAGNRNASEFKPTKIQTMLKTHMNKFIDNDLTQKIDMIFMNFLSRSKNNGAAIERYSGVLDPRLLATRDDWRIWKYKAEKGHIKGFDKLHLNLFIDTSGSYCSNEDKTNTILKSLTDLEKKRPFFSFDLVTMQCTETLRGKDERYIRASGGNDLDDKIHQIYRDLQKPDSFNYNIVLFDGDAFTDSPRGCYDSHHANFRVFNNTKTSIISDTDNEAAIKKYAPLAHSIFVGYGYEETRGKSYSDLLYDNILKAIHRALL